MDDEGEEEEDYVDYGDFVGGHPAVAAAGSVNYLQPGSSNSGQYGLYKQYTSGRVHS